MNGILIEVKPREDDRYDIYVGDEGDQFVNSSQGYENPEDAVAIVRRLWPPLPKVDDLKHIDQGDRLLDLGLIEDVLRTQRQHVDLELDGQVVIDDGNARASELERHQGLIEGIYAAIKTLGGE